MVNRRYEPVMLNSPCCIIDLVGISFWIKVLKLIRVDHLVWVYDVVQAQCVEDGVVMEVHPGHPVLVVSEGGQGDPGGPAPDHHSVIQAAADNHRPAQANTRHAQSRM